MTNQLSNVPEYRSMTREGMGKRIEQRASFELIRYANCWEDADILCRALLPASDSRILSIASAGDNVLALLAEGAEVVAADLSTAQLACLELRCAAFRSLEYHDVLGFLGILDRNDRLSTYIRLQGDLSPLARGFWNSHGRLVDQGVIQAGKFESYLRLFRTRILPWVHSRRTVDRLLSVRDRIERQQFYDQSWNSFRWRLLFRVFFSRFVMGRLGRDPEFFRYVEGSVADRILDRARYAVTELPTHNNPYLEFILTGNYARSLPRYLRPDKFEAVRSGLDRLTLFHGPIEQAGHLHAQSGFDGFNLSDIFEYLSPATSLEIYSELLNVAKPGSRLAYWNTFVPRHAPPELASRVIPLTDFAEQLFAQDRAFFYGKFLVEEVV